MVKRLLNAKQNYGATPCFIVAFLVFLVFVFINCVYKYFKYSDYYTKNGFIVSKSKNIVSCKHSYTCNCQNKCSINNEGKMVCSMKCDTCYEHFYDLEYAVKSTVNSFIVDNVDRQGLIEPKKWSEIKIGDYAATKKYFKNPIKRNTHSLFHNKKKPTISYPQIYDHYKIDNFINLTGSSDFGDYNKKIADLNKKLSMFVDVNIILIISNKKDYEFYEQIEREWLGGKLNDIIICVDLFDNDEINIVHVISFADEFLKQQLKYEIDHLDSFDFSKIEDILMTNIKKHYSIPSLNNFKYLLDN